MHESRTGCDTASNDASMTFSRAEYWRSPEDLEKTPEDTADKKALRVQMEHN